MILLQKKLIYGAIWILGILILWCIYPLFRSFLLIEIPFLFLLLAPFGLTSFSQWILTIAATYWLICLLQINTGTIRKLVRSVGFGSALLLVVHAAWVSFVLIKGGV